MVRAETGHTMFHTLTTIQRPLVEIKEIRSACDQLLSDLGLQSTRTVANTIFPSSYLRDGGSVSDLSNRYLKTYPSIRKLQPHRGDTYFGRLIHYPSPPGHVNQLERIINNLRSEHRNSGPKKARYELTLESLDDSSAQPHGSHAAVVRVVTDNQIMGFPCLSMCSLQLDGSRLHLLAHYRHEYLVERGYGNYLGVARLVSFISSQAGLQSGRLTIVTGHVDVEKAIRKVDKLATAIAAEPRTEMAIL
jgi:thymidylate synthase